MHEPERGQGAEEGGHMPRSSIPATQQLADALPKEADGLPDRA